MNASRYSGQTARTLRDTLRQSEWRRIKRRFVWLLLWLTASAWILSLMGCAVPVKPPCEPLSAPLMPVLLQPMPTQSYQLSAQNDIQRWQEIVKATSLTSKP